MERAEFEKLLSRKVLKRRLIEGFIILLGLALFFICHYLFDSTTEIIIQDWEAITYNSPYLLFAPVGLFCAIMSCTLLISDCLFSRFRTIQKDRQYLTVYRSLLRNIVYVDGVEKGRTAPLAFTNVVEVWLANRVRATVSFSTTIWYLAHISFSDYTTSMEV